jgi:hypothetical protein
MSRAGSEPSTRLCRAGKSQHVARARHHYDRCEQSCASCTECCFQPRASPGAHTARDASLCPSLPLLLPLCSCLARTTHLVSGLYHSSTVARPMPPHMPQNHMRSQSSFSRRWPFASGCRVCSVSARHSSDAYCLQPHAPARQRDGPRAGCMRRRRWRGARCAAARRSARAMREGARRERATRTW